MKNKKASLTTKQIIGLILLIASFLVILYFIFILNPKPASKKILCHNSVVEKSQVISGSKGWIETPLNCQTNYICYTYTGNCDKHDASYYDEIIKVKTKDDLYKNLANEMADCWWMFGEGKLQYVPNKWFFNSLSCSICSEIDFDSSINNSIFKSEFGFIQKNSFFNFLLNNNLPNKDITYAKYLYDTISKRELYKQGIISFDKSYIILTAVKSESFFSNKNYLYPTLLEKDSEEFKNMNCDHILTKG